MIYGKVGGIGSGVRALALCSLVGGCGDDGSASSTGDNGSTGNTTVDETTLPITVSATAADTTVSASNTDGETSSSSTTDDSTTTATPTTGDETSTSSTTDDSTTGGIDPVTVEWCILQSPAMIMETAGVGTMVYTRFYIETVTDQTQFNDPDDRVVVEIGYGADGSMPPTDWTWTAAMPNPGWDGTMAVGGFGNENNDEYQADLSFAAAGTYDYASRISGDGGSTWVYCDLDDLQTGGYTPAMAGDAVISD